MRRREELRCVLIGKPFHQQQGHRDTSWVHMKPAHHRDPSAHFRHALDIREHYERKLERANNLYMELNALMLQLELKERELLR